MKIAGNIEVQAMPHLPSSVREPTVRLTLGIPPFFAKSVDVPSHEVREMAAELLAAANHAEDKR